MDSRPKIRALKLEYFQNVLFANDMLCLQEAHASIEELEIVLPHLFSRYLVIASPGPGGAFIFIDKMWAGGQIAVATNIASAGRV